MYICVIDCVCERERDKDRDREGETQRKTKIETDRYIHTERERERALCGVFSHPFLPCWFRKHNLGHYARHQIVSPAKPSHMAQIFILQLQFLHTVCLTFLLLKPNCRVNGLKVSDFIEKNRTKVGYILNTSYLRQEGV